MASMETYNGIVGDPQDAIILFEACRLGILPRVQRRLSEKERHQIRSGSVFVWDEKEAGMRRWTDGKSWSASRVAGSFLTYREMEGKRPMPLGSEDPMDHQTDSRSNGDDKLQDLPFPPEEDGDTGVDGYRFKLDGFFKQSFSIATKDDRHLHLITYQITSQHSPPLHQPCNDPGLRNIRPDKSMYPDAPHPDPYAHLPPNRRPGAPDERARPSRSWHRREKAQLAAQQAAKKAFHKAAYEAAQQASRKASRQGQQDSPDPEYQNNSTYSPPPPPPDEPRPYSQHQYPHPGDHPSQLCMYPSPPQNGHRPPGAQRQSSHADPQHPRSLRETHRGRDQETRASSNPQNMEPYPSPRPAAHHPPPLHGYPYPPPYSPSSYHQPQSPHQHGADHPYPPSLPRDYQHIAPKAVPLPHFPGLASIAPKPDAMDRARTSPYPFGPMTPPGQFAPDQMPDSPPGYGPGGPEPGQFGPRAPMNETMQYSPQSTQHHPGPHRGHHPGQYSRQKRHSHQPPYIRTRRETVSSSEASAPRITPSGSIIPGIDSLLVGSGPPPPAPHQHQSPLTPQNGFDGGRRMSYMSPVHPLSPSTIMTTGSSSAASAPKITGSSPHGNVASSFSGPPPSMSGPPPSTMNRPPLSVNRPPPSTNRPPPPSLTGPPPPLMRGPPPSLSGPPLPSMGGPPPPSMNGPPLPSMGGPPLPSMGGPPPLSMSGPPPVLLRYHHHAPPFDASRPPLPPPTAPESERRNPFYRPSEAPVNASGVNERDKNALKRLDSGALRF